MKNKLVITTVFVLFAFAIFYNTANASTIFSDDFEDYNIGSLAGQGDWNISVPFYCGYSPQVQSSFVREGEKGIKVYGHYIYPCGAEKTGTPTTDGMITIYMEKFLGGTSTPDSIIELRQEDTVVVSMKNTTFFSYFDGSVGGYVRLYPPFFVCLIYYIID
ncbi:MAG: hypothetical protein ABIJ84_01060 [bacterium]